MILNSVYLDKQGREIKLRIDDRAKLFTSTLKPGKYLGDIRGVGNPTMFDIEVIKKD